jgi:hypothetical protein
MSAMLSAVAPAKGMTSARLTSRRSGSRISMFKSSLAAKDTEGCKTYMSILTSCRKVSRVTLLPSASIPRVASCDPLRPRLVVAEILKRNGESVSGAKLAPSSPGVKTEGLLQAGHEPCARRVGAKAKAANRAMVKYCTGPLSHKEAVNGGLSHVSRIS